MSAFICLPQHQGVLAAYMVLLWEQDRWLEELAGRVAFRGEVSGSGLARHVARLFGATNIRAVEERYGQDAREMIPEGSADRYLRACEAWARKYYFAPPFGTDPERWAWRVIRHASCLNYQCCELEGWRRTVAGQLIRDLLEAAAWAWAKVRAEQVPEHVWEFDGRVPSPSRPPSQKVR